MKAPIITRTSSALFGLFIGASASADSPRVPDVTGPFVTVPGPPSLPAHPASPDRPALPDSPFVPPDRGVPIRLVDEDPGLARIDRDDLDAVMAAVGDVGWADGNLQMGLATDTVRDQMGLDLVITSISDCLRDPDTRACADDEDDDGLTRYGLAPYPEYGGLDRLAFRRDRYARADATALVQSSLDIDPAAHAGRIGVLLYAQKHYPMRGLPFSPLAHQRSGLAVFQTVYGGRREAFNAGPEERLAFGVYERSTLDDTDGDGVRDAVTPLGVSALRALAGAGLAIDLSHASDAAILQSIRALPADVPVMANHTLAEDLPDHPGDAPRRGVDDEAILAIARQGGVMGIMPLKYFLIGEDRDCEPDPRSPDSLTSQFVRHVNHVVDVIDTDAASGLRGAEHVGLASDSYVAGRPGHRLWSACELDTPERWKRVLRRLAEERRGDGSYRYSVQDLRGIAGANFRRVLKRALPGFSPPEGAWLRRSAAPLAYELDWEDARVTSSPVLPALQFSPGDVRYRVIVEGKRLDPRDDRYRTLLDRFTNESRLTIPLLAPPAAGDAHWRVTIRTYDGRNPARYVDSVFYHVTA